MLLASHLRLSRCGVYQFRLVLPAVIAAALGQKVIVRSLETKRPEIARLVAYHLSARIVPLMRNMRRAMAIDPNSIDPNSIRELTLKNLSVSYPDGKVVKIDALTTSDDPKIAEQELREIADVIGPSSFYKPTLTEDGLAKALLERAEFEKIVAEAEARKAQSEVSRPLTIGEAIDSFMKFKGRTALTTQDTYGRRLEVLAGLAGGKERMLHDVSPDDVVLICDALLVLGAYGREVSDAQTVLAAPRPARVLSATTVKDYMILFGEFFDWAIGRKHYPKGDNPMAGIARPSEGNHGEGGGADVFLQSELETIFKPENFKNMKRPYHFWGPLIGLFTGARANEIAQLRTWDIKWQGDVLCMSITHEPDHEVPTRTKNKASIRILPIHPVLMEIGFEDFWEDMKATGNPRLFGLKADPDGKCERYFSRDFNEKFLKQVGVHQHRQKTFHSFRDTVSNVLGVKNMLWEPYADQWIGHASITTKSKHYAKDLLAPGFVDLVLPALNYPFLDFSQIRYERHRWDAWVKKQLEPKAECKPRVSEDEQKAILAEQRKARHEAIVKAKTGKKG